jgi:hypothetical protein
MRQVQLFECGACGLESVEVYAAWNGNTLNLRCTNEHCANLETFLLQVKAAADDLEINASSGADDGQG